MTLVRMALKPCPSPKIKTSNLPLGPFAHGPAATGDVDQTPGASLDEVEDTYEFKRWSEWIILPSWHLKETHHFCVTKTTYHLRFFLGLVNCPPHPNRETINWEMLHSCPPARNFFETWKGAKGPDVGGVWLCELPIVEVWVGCTVEKKSCLSCQVQFFTSGCFDILQKAYKLKPSVQLWHHIDIHLSWDAWLHLRGRNGQIILTKWCRNPCPL